MAESAPSPIEGLPAFIRAGRNGETRQRSHESAVDDGENEDDVPVGSLDSPILSPSSPPLDVRIDVKGAYIISAEDNTSTWEEESSTAGLGGIDEDLADLDLNGPEDYQHDSNDIRLPHNRSVVSHMAVDVSPTRTPFCHDIGIHANGIHLDWRKSHQTLLLVF
jgi:hypothetical protein